MDGKNQISGGDRAVSRVQGLGSSRGNQFDHRRADGRILRNRHHPEDLGSHESLALKAGRRRKHRSRRDREVRGKAARVIFQVSFSTGFTRFRQDLHVNPEKSCKSCLRLTRKLSRFRLT